MANTRSLVNGVDTWSIDTIAAINLGNPDDERVGRVVVQIRKNGSTFSLQFLKKITGSGVADASAVVTAYTTLNNQTVVTAGTAITADAIVEVYAPGCDTIVNVTAISVAPLLLEVRRLMY